MSQLPSYRALSTPHQAFVQAYVRSGCDATKAAALLHPNDSDETNQRRGWKLLQREDIKTAIADKLEQGITKYNTSREAMVERLFGLLDDVANLPESKQRVSHLKFVLDVYAQIAKISGLQHVHHHHDHQRSISINLQGVDVHGVPIQDIPTRIVNDTPAPEQDAAQLAISFPPADPVRYSMDELLDPDNELSREEGEDDLPFNV